MKIYRHFLSLILINIVTAGLVTRMTTDVTNVQNAYQMILRIADKSTIYTYLQYDYVLYY